MRHYRPTRSALMILESGTSRESLGMVMRFIGRCVKAETRGRPSNGEGDPLPSCTYTNQPIATQASRASRRTAHTARTALHASSTLGLQTGTVCGCGTRYFINVNFSLPAKLSRITRIPTDKSVVVLPRISIIFLPFARPWPGPTRRRPYLSANRCLCA